ncbi:MAG: hypothetical protein P8L45_09595 [Longimicrobiales bacterium]|nr:hypothetical protein [Longimicrobiales bacterium]
MQFVHWLARAARCSFVVLAFSVIAGQSPTDASAQSRPRVFFDCDGRDCNSQYYRTEITWVDWVNDRQVSDVHLIMTSLGTGAGGMEYQLDFLGREGQDEYVDNMRYQALSSDTDIERLDGVTHAMAIGLARFATVAGFQRLATVTGVDLEESGAFDRVVSSQEVEDPWDLWVFRVNGNYNVDGESRRKSKNMFGSFSATRISPTWKLNFSTNVNSREQEFELEQGTFTDTRTDWGVRPWLVYSLADHWSLAVRGEVARQPRFNQEFRWEVTPGFEYSFFTYEEATRKALTFSYRIGPAHRRYIEETLYGESSETRWEQSAEIDLSARQPWGETGASISASNFLFMPDTQEYDDGLYSINLRGDIDFRIVRGFSIRLDGNIGWVQDQIYLSSGGVTDEEALLRLQQLETDFEYGVSLGFSFQFGSIFNNVVNNRFRNAQGFSGRFR